MNLNETIELYHQLFSDILSSIDEKGRSKILDLLSVSLEKFRETERIAEILAVLLKQETNFLITSRLTKLIGRCRSPKFIPVLKEYLKHPDLRVVANTIEGLGYIQSPEIKQIIAPFLESEDNRIKANAAREIYRYDRAKAHAVLAEMIASPVDAHRDSATFMLAQIKDEIAMQRLLEIFKNETKRVIYIKTIQPLLTSSSEEIISALREFQKKCNDREKAAILARVLEVSEEKKTSRYVPIYTGEVATLISMLRNGTPEERKKACFEIAKKGDRTLIDVLREATNDELLEVRYVAKRAIDLLASGNSMENEKQGTSRLDILEKEHLITEFVETEILGLKDEFPKEPADSQKNLTGIDPVFLTLDINHPDPRKRARTANNLLHISRDTRGAKEALELVLKRLREETDMMVKSQLLRVAGKLGGSKVLPVLKKHLETDRNDYRVVANIIEALSHIDDKECYGIALQYLNSEDNRIRANAIQVIWKFNKDQTLKILRAMISSEKVWMRGSAAYVLLVLEPLDPRLIEIAVAALPREKDPSVFKRLASFFRKHACELSLTYIEKAIDIAKDGEKEILKKVHAAVTERMEVLKRRKEQEEKISRTGGPPAAQITGIQPEHAPSITSGSSTVKSKDIALELSRALDRLAIFPPIGS